MKGQQKKMQEWGQLFRSGVISADFNHVNSLNAKIDKIYKSQQIS